MIPAIRAVASFILSLTSTTRALANDRRMLMGALIPMGRFDPVPARYSRATERALARIETSQELRRAEVECAADIQASKADAVAFVASRSQLLQAQLSQQEAQLAKLTPMATTALEAIGQAATLGIVDIVMDTVHRLRRL
jgi:hypothetical protein